ncbi:RdgB/HAM1 family non-canonical purine NTP pyrophosphatase [Puniceicoccaceae bacterium K14]|nr:RdgB/HAM1 family non-canonical purine NTP pyrophosphatase [Puniceicoccaceae bacterium K14]
MKLYLATGNAHKVKELQEIIAAAKLPIEVFSAKEVGGMPEVVEDQETFTGNALKKGLALAQQLPEGTWALADDSGLCVDCLDGAPGVYSARYAGEKATDTENLNKLLHEMEGLPLEQRSASFQCHLAMVSSSGDEQIFIGQCEGHIIEEACGEGGFGYDPVFVPQGKEKTFAEISSEEKAGLSHRGNALKEMIEFLRNALSAKK